jgi:hypothetical protein
MKLSLRFVLRMGVVTAVSGAERRCPPSRGFHQPHEAGPGRARSDAMNDAIVSSILLPTFLSTAILAALVFAAVTA